MSRIHLPEVKRRAHRTGESADIRRRSGRPRASAFTLIELLVVVSIIALLISILLPSLRRARDQAKAVSCASMIGGTLRGMVTYTAEWNGWIPGSPGTSGSILLGKSSPPIEDEEDIPDSPTQIFDWAGPIAGASSQLPFNRGDRHKTLVEDVFACSANGLVSEPYYQGQIGPHGSWGIVKMNSYLTMRQFMLWPRSYGTCHIDGYSGPPAWGECAPFPQAQLDINVGGDATSGKNYVPNLDRVARASAKVFLADGSRFTTDEGTLDHDIAWEAGSGGAFSDGGPSADEEYLRSYLTEGFESAYSYRHYSGGDRALEVGFFDAHVEIMSRKRSRFPDPWWPTGSLIPWADFNDETQNLLIELGRDDDLVDAAFGPAYLVR